MLVFEDRIFPMLISSIYLLIVFVEGYYLIFEDTTLVSLYWNFKFFGQDSFLEL